MQQIRGMKVKPDSAAGAASRDDDAHVDDRHSNTNTSHTPQTAVQPRSDASRSKAAEQTASKMHSSQTGVRPRSDIDQPKVADKTALKTRNKKADGRTTASASTAAPTENSSVNPPTSKNAVINGGSGDHSRPPTVTDTSSLASMSSDQPTITELHLLRTCARCEKRESTSHEFKKCKK